MSSESLFFFNDTATTEIYTLSLHDALPISRTWLVSRSSTTPRSGFGPRCPRDRKSTRLNSSHDQISYAVFCLKKKKKQMKQQNVEALRRQIDETSDLKRRRTL